MHRVISEKFPDLLTASGKLSKKLAKHPLHSCAMDVLRRRTDPPDVSVHAGTENVYTMCSLTFTPCILVSSIHILFYIYSYMQTMALMVMMIASSHDVFQVKEVLSRIQNMPSFKPQARELFYMLTSLFFLLWKQDVVPQRYRENYSSYICLQRAIVPEKLKNSIHSVSCMCL